MNNTVAAQKVCTQENEMMKEKNPTRKKLALIYPVEPGVVGSSQP
jgi:hypothetical protein